MGKGWVWDGEGMRVGRDRGWGGWGRDGGGDRVGWGGVGRGRRRDELGWTGEGMGWEGKGMGWDGTV